MLVLGAEEEESAPVLLLGAGEEEQLPISCCCWQPAADSIIADQCCRHARGGEREGWELPIHRLINLPLHEQIHCKEGWDAGIIAGAGRGL